MLNGFPHGILIITGWVNRLLSVVFLVGRSASNVLRAFWSKRGNLGLIQAAVLSADADVASTIFEACSASF